MPQEQTTPTDQAMQPLFDAVEDRVIQWRHHIHAHPELPNREVNTAKLIADHLRAFGLDDVRTNIAGHGVVGVLRGGMPGPRTMALRADIDALPVQETSGVGFASKVVDTTYPGGPFPVAHACGHDCHAAMLMGAAEVLAKVRAQLAGTVVFIFQTAEEGAPVDEYAGAKAMLDAGALRDLHPTMVFGMHVGPAPKGFVGYHVGAQYAASVRMAIEITGRQAHGSQPWQGIDPMPVAADIISAMGQLYRQIPATDPATITIGHLHDVGRFNIVGGHITLEGTIRCFDDGLMQDICGRVTRTAKGIAVAYGASAEVKFMQNVPAVHNAAEWLKATLPTLQRVVGAANVGEVPPTMGYDDMSEFVNRYGGLYVFLGAQDSEFVDGKLTSVPGGRGIAVNHNPGFYADDGVLISGVRLHVAVALDHLTGRLVAD